MTTHANQGPAAHASVGQWVEGARPRTLPAAVSPVVAATGVAAYEGGADLLLAVLALVAVGALGLAGVAALTTTWALLGLLPLLLLVRPCLAVLSGAVGRDLIAVLKSTGTAELLAAVVSALALVVL